jgi:hypothetical protein
VNTDRQTIQNLTNGLLQSQTARVIQQTQRDLTQTGIAAPGDYDQDLGVFVAIEADGSEVRYRPGSNNTRPDQISLVKTAHSQVAFGDYP